MQSSDAQAANHMQIIRNVLRAHPGASDAEVVGDIGDGFSARVVPERGYLDNVLGRAADGAAFLRKWRKASDLNQLAKDSASAPAGFNTVGWNSSYTRQPIPDMEMREWVETTAADILAFRPRQVYEIGCGTGLLLLRVAPRCDQYVGADFSPVVLEKLREQLPAFPSLKDRVEILERSADNFDGVDHDSFDTVLLNSVIQYFPNVAYLTDVIAKSVDAVRPGGRVFLGDIRNYSLLTAFATSVEFYQSPDDLCAGELRNRIHRRLAREQELLLSPAFFLSLRLRFPKISRVEIRPLRGSADNEMTCYRYQAILHIGKEIAPTAARISINWSQQELTLDEIRSTLRQHPHEPILIHTIRNARIERDLAAHRLLSSAAPQTSVSELRGNIDNSLRPALHPQEVWDLQAESFGFAVALSWAACRQDGSYDAMFVPNSLLADGPLPLIQWPEPDTSAFAQIANAPGQFKLREELITQLIKHCRNNLSENLIPRIITLADSIPDSPRRI